ncbi:MAG: DUF11 domain-containing protein [Acidobacteriota bacterium]
MLDLRIFPAALLITLLILGAPAALHAGITATDLAITKDDGATTSNPGDPIVYTITATNNGPTDALGADAAAVSDLFPADLTGCTWTCTASAGSTCTAIGAGDISDSADLLVGGTATYTATCTIDAGASGTLTNTATISSLLPDPVPANNSATDNNTLTPTFFDDFEDGDFADWTLDGIGHANQVSALVVDDAGDNVLALTSDGATAYIQRDNGGFLYQTVGGDFRLESDVDTSTMTTGKSFRKAGLMVRASLDDLDLRLLVMHLPVHGRLQFVARETFGGPGNVKVALEEPGVPSTVRLAIERVGQTLSVSYSLDQGATWITPTTGLGGSIDIAALPETLLIGLAVVSNDISVTSTAQFDDVTIFPAP